MSFQQQRCLDNCCCVPHCSCCANLRSIKKDKERLEEVIRSHEKTIAGHETTPPPLPPNPLTVYEREHLRNMSIQFIGMTNDNRRLTNQVGELTVQVGDLTRRNDDLTRRNDNLTLQVDDLTRRNDDLTLQVDDLTLEVCGLKVQNKNQQAQIDGLNNKFDFLVSKLISGGRSEIIMDLIASPPPPQTHTVHLVDFPTPLTLPSATATMDPSAIGVMEEKKEEPQSDNSTEKTISPSEHKESK